MRHPVRLPSAPIPMTACACLGKTFEEIAAGLADPSAPATETLETCGAGVTCTACRQDLILYLATRGLATAQPRP